MYRGASAFVGYNLIRDFTGAGIWVYGARTTATVYRNSIRYLHAAEAPDADGSSAVGGHRAYLGPLVTIRDNVVRSGPGPGWPTPVLDTGMDLPLGTGAWWPGTRCIARDSASRPKGLRPQRPGPSSGAT